MADNPKIILDVEARLTNLEEVKKHLDKATSSQKIGKTRQRQKTAIDQSLDVLKANAKDMDPNLFYKEYMSILESMKILAKGLMGVPKFVKTLEDLETELKNIQTKLQEKTNELKDKPKELGMVLKPKSKDKSTAELTGADYTMTIAERKNVVSKLAPIKIGDKDVTSVGFKELTSLSKESKDPKVVLALEERIKVLNDARILKETEINKILNERRTLKNQEIDLEKQRANKEWNSPIAEPATDAQAALSVALDVQSQEAKARIETAEAALKEKQAKESETEETNRSTYAVKNFNQEKEKTPNIVAKAIKSFISYQVIIRQLRRLIETAVQTVTELDKALTNQAIVSSLTREETWKLVGSYQQLAAQTGFTTTEIAAVATRYFQQGKIVSEVMMLTEAAAKSAKVAGIDAKEAVDYLTTAINGFGLAAKDALSVSDKFAALAASSATDYEELATALSKVASQANLAGMSMDFTLGLLAKGIETTREAPESIGTALKTIIARMREITDYGATLEDGMNLNNVEKQLAYINIELRDSQNQLRSTQDVINELGLKWDSLTGSQQAAIAKALAGTRQQARLIAMLNNYERTLELVAISQESIGATNAQQAEYLEGMGAAINRLKTAYQAFITSITDAKVIIWFVDMITNVVNGITSLLEGGKGITLLITSLILGIMSTLPKIIGFVQNLMLNYYGLGAAAQARLLKEQLITLELKKQAALSRVTLTGADRTKAIVDIKEMFAAEEDALSKSAKEGMLSPSKGQTALKTAGTVAAGLAIAAVATTLFVQLVQNILKTTQKIAAASIEKISKSQTNIYNNVKQINTIKKLQSSFELLRDKVIKTTEDFTEMENIRRQLIETYKDEDQKIKEKLSLEMLMQDQNSRIANLQKDTQDELASIEKEYNANKYSFGQGAATMGKSTGLGAAIGLGIGIALAPVTAGLSVPIAAAFGTAIGEIAGFFLMLEEKGKIEDRKAKVKEMLATENGLQQAQYYYAAQFGDSQKEMFATQKRGETASQLYGALVSNIDQEEMLKLITDSGLTAEQYANKFASAMNTIGGSLSKFTDTSVPYAERIKGVHNAINQLNQDGMPQLAEEMEGLYADLLAIEKTFPTSLGYLDKFGWSVQQLTDFAKAMGDQSDKIMQLIGSALSSGSEDAWDNLDRAMNNFTADAISAVADLIAAGRTVQSVAEEQTRTASTIKGLRETQAKWGEMTAAEKASFLGENASLFMTDGKADQTKLDAFINGGDISGLIEDSEKKYQTDIRKDYEDLLRVKALQIQAEEARIREGKLTKEEEADALAKIAALEVEISGINIMLGEVETMFDLSLAEIIEKQKKQLETYKDMLEEQKDLTIESLEKRKEAYSDYFDAINKQQETQDYEGTKLRLETQISKLGAASDATSISKMAELQGQLANLEEERTKTVEQEAQDAVIDALDSEIDRVTEYYDKMLENDNLLLQALTQQNFESMQLDYLKLLITQGKTEAEITQAMNDFAETFYAGQIYGTDIKMPNVDTSIPGTSAENNTTNNTVNFNGETYSVSQSDQKLLDKLIKEIINRSRAMTGI